MNETNRPTIPKKLPPQDRKKLSITFPDYDPNRISSQSNSIFLNRSNLETQEYIGVYYKEPIDQPKLRDEYAVNEKTNISFFNDSIYLPLDKEISVSDFSEEKSRSNSYLSLDRLELEESIDAKKNDSFDNKSEVKSLNGSLLIWEINDDPVKPPIPPKRAKKLLSLSKLSLASPSDQNNSKKESIIIDEYFNYLSPNDLKASNLDSFRNEIFKNESNKICADCKRSNLYPNWISCVYLMTLCDYCAECHLKLPHIVTRFYMKKIDSLFENLQSNDQKLDHMSAEVFLKIFDQAGNEKINSLLEYNLKNNFNSLNTNSEIECFIKDKYLFKKFINLNEIDLSSNFLEELNKSLYQIVSGPSIPMTIYYIFLGGNRNYFQNQQTLLDVSINSNQVLQYLYLSMNKSLKYNELIDQAKFEFIGDVLQIFNVTSATDKTLIKKVNIYLQLKDNYLIITQFNTNGLKSQKILLSSIIKIFTMCNVKIELKWCTSNHCILSHFLEFSNQNEQQIWLKNIITKLNPNINIKIGEILQNLQIDSFGYLTILNQSDEQKTEQNYLTILLQSLPTQIEKFFQKVILFVNTDSDSTELNYEIVDVRKINKIKLDNEILVLDILGKSLKLKSDGYGENLKLWNEKLVKFVHLEFRSFEEQFLNRENCVLLVDKCCSFIELYHITDPNVYILSEKKSKKYTGLMKKLERDRCAKLESKDCSPTIVAKVLKNFFSKHVRSFHSDLNFFDQNQNSVFYSTIKRIAIHINLVAYYHFLNQMSKESIFQIFRDFIFAKRKFEFLKFLTDNCEDYFRLEDGFLQGQLDILNKVIKLKTVQKRNLDTNAKYLITIYLFHKNSEQSFQIQIDSKFTCKDALLRARDEFKLFESKYWCLFEVFDPEQHFNVNGNFETNLDGLLERVIPSKAILIECISNWSSFNFVVKCNSIQIEIERFYVTNELNFETMSFLDKIQSLVLCELCGSFRTSFHTKQNSNCCHSSHKKWKNCYLSLRNAVVKILELKNNEDQTAFDFDSAKVVYEEKIENFLFYYGLYGSNYLDHINMSNSIDDISGSKLFSSMAKFFGTNGQEISLSDEEFLTLFDKNKKLLHVIHLSDKEKALTRYCNLFKLAYYPDTWTVFKSDQMPDMKPKVPELRKYFGNNNCKN